MAFFTGIKAKSQTLRTRFLFHLLSKVRNSYNAFLEHRSRQKESAILGRLQGMTKISEAHLSQTIGANLIGHVISHILKARRAVSTKKT
jgi:hypothetical protein